jgi:hypothetical protein
MGVWHFLRTRVKKIVFLKQNQQLWILETPPVQMDVIMNMEKSLTTQTPHAKIILQQMDLFRTIPPEINGRYQCMCTFVAFGTTTERTLLMSCLMYALQPDLVYSAYVKSYESKEYETILLLRKKISVDMIDNFLELFRMSTCLIPFDTLMSDEMATSISRIHTGSNQYGNFFSKPNTSLRRKFYYKRQKQKKMQELQHVLDVTGMRFSPDNMIRLYHELSVSRCDNASLRSRIQTFHQSVASLRM